MEIIDENTVKFINTFNKPLNKHYTKFLFQFKKIIFGDEFNKSIKFLGQINCEKCNQNCLCNTSKIKEIVFGEKFNQDVNNLHNSITHLTFGDKFNQDVNNLPNNITHLTFGDRFNRSVDNLPNNITHLVFGKKFNQPIDNLPNSIIDLSLGDSFTHNLKNFPNSIKNLRLTIGQQNITDLEKMLYENSTFFSDTVKCIKIDTSSSKYDLEKLISYFEFFDKIDYTKTNLKKLEIKVLFSCVIKNCDEEDDDGEFDDEELDDDETIYLFDDNGNYTKGIHNIFTNAYNEWKEFNTEM